MEINQLTQLNNFYKPAFLGKRLYSLNLKQHLPNCEDKFIPAYFTQIDETDIPFLKLVLKYWEDTPIGKNILTGIFNKISDKTSKNKFFMIECPQMPNIQDKIRAMCACFNANNSFCDLELSLLQSANDIMSATKLDGGGIGMLRGLCRYIEDKKQFNSLSWVSSPCAVKWYRKMNIKEEKNPLYSSFSINRDEISAFLENTRKKFGDIVKVKE